MRILFLTIFLIAGLALSQGQAATARLAAEAEWRYGQYGAESEGETIHDASHFTQQYSLLYSRKGKLNGGRGGAYEVSLGGEWTDISTEVDGEDVELDSAKLLYSGNLLLAPGGLPFRLSLFSGDMHRTVLVSDFAAPGGSMIDPGIVDNFSNGQAIETGATLLLGIRNGSYLGRYREIMSNLPRVLVDYRQVYVHNVRSRTPQHYRLRDLAFVSLNKKDNWFHYRVKDYTDYLDPTEDFLDKAYILGTIDHTMKRQWINFTNWIQISADGTYQVANPSRADVPVERTYNLNMFAIARRSDWGASTFATANRRATGHVLQRSLSVPIYGHRRLSPDTSWRLVISTASNSTDNFDDQTRLDEDTVYSSLQVDSLQTRPYRFTTRIQGEVKNSGDRQSSSSSLGVELSSNPMFQRPYSLYGSYTLSHYSDEGDIDTFEHSGVMRAERSFARMGRFDFEQNVLYTSGPVALDVSSNIRPGGLEPLEGSDAGLVGRTGSIWRSTTALGWDLVLRKRMDSRLSLVYDYVREEQESMGQVVVNHSLKYDSQSFRASMENEWVRGDDVGGAVGLASDELEVASFGGGDERLSHRSSLSFSQGRLWEVVGQLNYDLGRRSTGDNSVLGLVQGGRYSIYTTRGLVRKLIELNEELSYERFSVAGAASQKLTTLTLGMAYFPYRVLKLGGDVRYRNFGQDRADDLRYTLTAQFDFEKLKVEMDYVFATALDTVAEADRDEHRWEIKVKKIF